MTFKTVFDVAEQGYANWWFPASGSIFLVVGALLVFRPALMRRWMRPFPYPVLQAAFSWFFFLFALLWTTVSFAGTYAEYRNAVSDLRNGHFSVVEGGIMDFVPMPYSGHSNESFTVAGRRFSYSDYLVTPGFHTTSSNGGPIHEDLYVRVTYSGNVILRLEIAE